MNSEALIKAVKSKVKQDKIVNTRGNSSIDFVLDKLNQKFKNGKEIKNLITAQELTKGGVPVTRYIGYPLYSNNYNEWIVVRITENGAIVMFRNGKEITTSQTVLRKAVSDYIDENLTVDELIEYFENVYNKKQKEILEWLNSTV